MSNNAGRTYLTLNRRGMPYTSLMQEFLDGKATGKYCSVLFHNGKFDPVYVELVQDFLDQRLKSC